MSGATATCGRCGAESTLTHLYGPAPLGRARWCPYCRAYGWYYPGQCFWWLAIPVVTFFLWLPEVGAWRNWLAVPGSIVIAYFLAEIVSTLLHEAMHLLGGALVGFRVYGFKLGHGDPLRTLRVGRVRIDFAPGWYRGRGEAYVSPQPGTAPRRRYQIMLLAPYPAHVAVALLAWPSDQAWTYAGAFGWMLAAVQIQTIVGGLARHAPHDAEHGNDRVLVERAEAMTAETRLDYEWEAALYEMHEAPEGEEEKVLDRLMGDRRGTPAYEAMLYRLRFPDVDREPTDEELLAMARLEDHIPDMPDDQRWALGDPRGIDMQRSQYLYRADRLDGLLAHEEACLAAATSPGSIAAGVPSLRSICTADKRKRGLWSRRLRSRKGTGSSRSFLAASHRASLARRRTN